MRRKFRNRSRSSSSSRRSSYSSSKSRSLSKESDRSQSRRQIKRFKRDRSSSTRRNRFNQNGQRGYNDWKGHDFSGQIRRDERNWNDKNFVSWNHNAVGKNENVRRYGNGNEFGSSTCHNPLYSLPEVAPYPTQPPKLTFKLYVSRLDDCENENDILQKYKTYLSNFTKDQINAFFESHKNEDWFKRKYYSKEFELRQKEKEGSFKHRKDVFMNLLQNGSIANVTLDLSSNDKLQKLLDLASSLMESKSETKSSQVKIQSIFLKNISPKIVVNDILSVCKNLTGFTRLCIQDPEPKKNFFRKGWITFDGSVDIISTCEQLNNARIGECDLGAIVNRELKQRVRAVNGLSVHKSVAKQDIKHAAKIIQSLDKKWKMWEGDTNENPMIKSALKYLVEEIDYEEAILGDKINRNDNEISNIEREDGLLNALDGMLLYLRVVYSIDYYAALEYHQEDEMPHRCGIIHVRGVNARQQFTKNEVEKHLKWQEANIQPFLNVKFEIDKAEAVKLGLKNQDEEVEKFISKNMQELGKDKWLCPLSGKKFKGPEFVKKHILTKHEDKIEDVKNEVMYFNNFVCDPNRLSLPEYPTSQLLPPPPQPTFENVYDRFPNGASGFNSHPPYSRRGRHSPNLAQNRNHRQTIDRRPLVSYHDYDAVPDDPE